MTSTVLVPDWEAMSISPSGNVYSCDGFNAKYDPRYDCYTFDLKSRYETMPDALKDMQMKVIALVKHNSPVTQAHDGLYGDDNFTARVETYIKDGWAQQSIRVEGRNGVTLEEVNMWFDELCADKDKPWTSLVLYSLETNIRLGR